jgi:hypothetical protein
VVVDDVVSVTEAAVQNRPAQSARGRSETHDQGIPLLANTKR